MDVPRTSSALEELRWLEQLALKLVEDPEEARDLSQETLLASLRGESPAPERRRPWLVGTLRNLASKARRRRARRFGYEREGARSELLPSAEELAMRADQQSKLLSFVQALPEAYRTPLLLRYYEGASVARIAETLELPVRTVHTRLQRGLQRLRERMDADHPDGRSGWMGALLLGVGEAPQEMVSDPADATPFLGSWGTTALLATAALGITMVGARYLLDANGRASSSDGLAVGLEERPKSAVAPIVPFAERESLAPGLVRAEVWEESPKGIVLDWEGEPVVGARLHARVHEGVRLPLVAWKPLESIDGPPLSWDSASDAAGRFSLPTGAQRLMLEAEAPGYVCALAGVWDPENGEPPFLGLAPARSLEARVVDELGQGLADVEVWVTLEESVAARFSRPFHLQYPRYWTARCDRDGRFALESVPDVPELRLTLHRDDLGTRTWAVSDVTPSLCMTREATVRLLGTVLDELGNGIGAASVFLGSSHAMSAPDGSFELTSCLPLPRELWGVAPGRAPTPFPLEPGAARPGEQVELGTFTLSQAALAIEGDVLDSGGEPRSGLLVWVEDPTLPGPGDTGPLEALAAGSEGFAHCTRTAASGSFRLGGLSSGRTYTLRILDEDTALWFETGPVRAGQRVDVSFPAAQALRRVEGRLVDDRGFPLAGASILVQGPGYGSGESRVYAHGRACESDSDGRFVLEDVPRSGVWLRADHPDALLTSLTLDVDPGAQTWVLPRAARFQLELADWEDDMFIELLDVVGEPVSMWSSNGLGRAPVEQAPLWEGRTAVLEVPCNAATLVIHSSTRRESTTPVQFEAGETLRLRL